VSQRNKHGLFVGLYAVLSFKYQDLSAAYPLQMREHLSAADPECGRVCYEQGSIPQVVTSDDLRQETEGSFLKADLFDRNVVFSPAGARKRRT
jgi:hypothetical protein